QGGMLIGPALGGFIALLNLGVVFTIAAALSAITVIALVTLPNVRAQATVDVPARAMQIARRLLPLLLLGAGTSYMIGAFDTIWSLYLTYRGATTFLLGLSFVAFALPATLLSGYAGSLGDRFGARRFIVLALFCTAFFAALYPFIASVPWLIGLGLIEGIFTISGVPSTMAEVSRNAEPGQYARTQAVFQTCRRESRLSAPSRAAPCSRFHRFTRSCPSRWCACSARSQVWLPAWWRRERRASRRRTRG